MDENQTHMVLYFAGIALALCNLGKYTLVIWTIQWFMLYHNMIENKAAIQKAKWARNTIWFIFALSFVVLILVIIDVSIYKN